MGFGSKGQKRVQILMLCFLFSMLILIANLFLLQCFCGREYAKLAFKQHTQGIGLGLVRGNILDRNLVPLNAPSKQKNLYYFPFHGKVEKTAVYELAKILKIPSDKLLNKMQNTSTPIKLANNLSLFEVQKINRLNVPNFLIAEEEVRYGENLLSSHVIGYIGETTEGEIRQDKESLGKYIGRAGTELAMEEVLHGEQRRLFAVVDAKLQIIKGLGYRSDNVKDFQGKDVVLTIDKRIQTICEDIFDAYKVKKGAAVVMNPKNGEILAMLSRPNFYPQNVASYFDSPDAPLVNRAVCGYPPGSVFKVIVAAAGLDEGAVSWDTKDICTGQVQVGNRKIACHDKDGHGELILREALAQSCNVYFIHLGQKLGSQKILDYARKFGLGQKTGIGLPEEKPGYLPGNKKIYPGDLANLSIGQGELLITPLQAARVMAIIVNNGRDVVPKLYLGIKEKDGKMVKKYSSSSGGARVISGSSARILKNMLLETTAAGTGKSAAILHWGSGGKTGTAEIKTADGKLLEKHGWFAGYTPARKPRYVIVVFIEDSPSGSAFAAKIFREIGERILKIEVF